MPRRAFPCVFCLIASAFCAFLHCYAFCSFCAFCAAFSACPACLSAIPRARIFPGFSGFSDHPAVPGGLARTALCRFGPFPHVPARKKSFWAADSSHPCPARPAFRSPRLSPAPSVWASLPFRRNPAPLFWAFRLFRRNPAPSVLSFPRFRQKGKIVGKRTVCPIRKGSRKPKKPEKKPPEPVPKGGKEIFRRSEVLF